VNLKASLLALALGAQALAADGSLTAAGPQRLVKPRAVQGTSRDEVVGSLSPARLLPMGFELGGRLERTFVKRGDTVKPGQALGSLDAEIVNAQVAQAEAGLAAAEAQEEIARDVAGRNQKLQAEGSVSEVQSKSTTANSKAAAAQVLAAKAGLAQARAARKRHDLRAPFSGVLVEAPDTAGGLIGPGLPVYILQQVDTLVLKTTINESSRGVIKPGLKVRVQSVNGPAATTEAFVRVVLQTADPQTRRIPVEIEVPNADGGFVANTLVRASLPLGESKSAIIIPTTALASTGGDHVFSVDRGGVLKKVSITILERSAKELTVVPAEPVEQIVDYPAATLVEGTKVTQL
jgi:membrane fusion protein, multidrug efflux system